MRQPPSASSARTCIARRASSASSVRQEWSCHESRQRSCHENDDAWRPRAVDPPVGAGAAGAQTPPAEERPPFQIGPVGVRPRLVITNLGVDNNVFNESENPKSDFTFTTSPELVLSLDPGRVKLTSTAGTDLVYYKEYTSERSVSRRFRSEEH